MWRWLTLIGLAGGLFLFISGCAGEPAQFEFLDPSTSPAKSKKIVFPNGLEAGPASQVQATALAEIMVQSHNMAVRQRERIERDLAKDAESPKRVIEAQQRNQATAQQAWDMVRNLAARQGTGEITIFFPVDSATIPEGSSEYQRLVRFADFLARESHGRGINFISVGSASAFGSKKRNIKLARKRAQAPIPILDHYLVKVGHKFFKIYGVGDTYSPKGVSMREHQRYQYVHLTAFYGPGQPADTAGDLGAANERSLGPGLETIPSGQGFTNSLGMSFKRISPGTFVMGSPPGEYGRSENEHQHQVTLTKGLFIQTTEVTQGQWERLMGDNPSYFQNCGQDCPVEQVSWYDVQEFIAKLNQREHTRAYRLPTEAEWEYACRAGSQSAFANAGQITGDRCGYNPDLNELGWYYRNSDKGTHTVGQKGANAWGLHDMHGNVWEWCQDWQGKYPFQAVVDPKGPDQGLNRIRRGGNWSHYPMFCRSAYRSWFDPQNETPGIGFRLVRDIQEPPSSSGARTESNYQGGPELEQCLVLGDVIFAFDSAQLRKQAQPVLDKAATILRDRSGKIVVQGHTCSIGSKEYNQGLSERRAQTVAQALRQRDLAASRLQVVGLGEAQPKFDNASESGRRLNRRVEIHF